MDNRGFVVRFLTIAKDFPMLKRVPAAKRPGCDSDYSPQPNAEVMNFWGCSCTFFLTRQHWLHRDTLNSHVFVKSWIFMVVWRSCKNMNLIFENVNYCLLITVFHYYISYCFSVAFRHICRFTFFCFIFFFTSLSHYISGIPFFFFIPPTISLFAEAISYLPCVIYVHTILTCYFPHT